MVKRLVCLIFYMNIQQIFLKHLCWRLNLESCHDEENLSKKLFEFYSFFPPEHFITLKI